MNTCNNNPEPMSFQKINSTMIVLANTYLAMALFVEDEFQQSTGLNLTTYRISSGEVIYIYKKGEFVHHITTGDGDAYEMRVVEDNQQTLDQNRLEAASVLLEIYTWYHKYD